MTAEQILRLFDPEQLFSNGDVDAVKREYRAWSLKWHPDHSKNAKAFEVFAHIHNLYESALKKIAKGTWEVPGLLKKTMRSGGSLEMHYQVKKQFELGLSYFGRDHVVYLIDHQFYN